VRGLAGKEVMVKGVAVVVEEDLPVILEDMLGSGA